MKKAEGTDDGFSNGVIRWHVKSHQERNVFLCIELIIEGTSEEIHLDVHFESSQKLEDEGEKNSTDLSWSRLTNWNCGAHY